MKKIKVARKLLKLGQPIKNPFNDEHEWLFNLLSFYNERNAFNLNDIYSKFTQNTDYYTIRQQFMIFLLEDIRQYIDIKKFKQCDDAVLQTIHLWKTDKMMSQSAAWSAAESAARNAAWSAAIKKSANKLLEIIEKNS